MDQPIEKVILCRENLETRGTDEAFYVIPAYRTYNELFNERLKKAKSRRSRVKEETEPNSLEIMAIQRITDTFRKTFDRPLLETPIADHVCFFTEQTTFLIQAFQTMSRSFQDLDQYTQRLEMLDRVQKKQKEIDELEKQLKHLTAKQDSSQQSERTTEPQNLMVSPQPGSGALDFTEAQPAEAQEVISTDHKLLPVEYWEDGATIPDYTKAFWNALKKGQQQEESTYSSSSLLDLQREFLDDFFQDHTPKILVTLNKLWKLFGIHFLRGTNGFVHLSIPNHPEIKGFFHVPHPSSSIGRDSMWVREVTECLKKMGHVQSSR